MSDTEQDLSSFVHMGNKDARPDTPRLFLQVKAPPRLSLTLPYQIEITLRRARKDCSDNPCIVRWSPTIDGFSARGLVLLREDTATGSLETCAVDYSNVVEDHVVVDASRKKFLWELAPGAEVRFTASLPAHYYTAMRAGETYTLLYPGGEVALWDFGTIEGHVGQTMAARHPNLVIPGGARISFTARVEEPQWPERVAYEAEHGFDMANQAERRWRQEEARKSMRILEGWPEPIEPEERVPGAPLLSVTLECPPTITSKERFAVTMKVTYTGEVCAPEGPEGGYTSRTTTRPITFRSWSIIGLDGPREGFLSFRQRRANDNDDEINSCRDWEPCHLGEDGPPGFNIYEGPDVAVKVTEDDNFTSLRPGETWTTSRTLQTEQWSYLPPDTVPGDAFLYGFTGAVVDWWDWGGADEHADTVVKLPCWISGRVVEPADNGGRPKLVIPHSEGVVFKVV